MEFDGACSLNSNLFLKRLGSLLEVQLLVHLIFLDDLDRNHMRNIFFVDSFDNFAVTSFAEWILIIDIILLLHVTAKSFAHNE